MSGIAGGVIGGIGAIGSIFGGEQAANALKDAGNQLYSNAQGMYNTDQTNLNPYMQTGATASNLLTQQLPSLSQGFDPTQAQLQSLPGYQFELQQGLEATQNGYAAQGLGVSGAAMKGAASYAQGLASTDLTNYANIYNTNRTDTANILTGGAQLGMNAASTLGQLGQSTLGYEQNGLEFAANGKAQGDMAPWQGISALGSDVSGMGGIGSMGSLMGGSSRGSGSAAYDTTYANQFTNANPSY
jgi:hypothetical protein